MDLARLLRQLATTSARVRRAFPAAVGLYLRVTLFTLPIVATVTGRHIAYESPRLYALAAMPLDLLGTCASLIFSSHSQVVAFGVAAFASAVAAYAFPRHLVHLGLVLLRRRAHRRRAVLHRPAPSGRGRWRNTATPPRTSLIPKGPDV